jgi:hypothetical protein
MIKMYRFLLALPFVLSGYGQEKIEIEMTGRGSIKLELYRAIIELNTTDSNLMSIEQSLYDFDEYETSGKLITFEDEERRGELKIEKSSSAVSIVNTATRELQFLRITIPSHNEVSVQVQGYGEFRSSALPLSASVQIFQGKINSTVHRTLSASIVRDGDIDIKVPENREVDFLLLNTFDGDISLDLPPDISAEIKVTTELGEVEYGKGYGFKVQRGDSFDLKVNGESETRFSRIYKGILNGGYGKISLRNVKGTIDIN